VKDSRFKTGPELHSVLLSWLMLTSEDSIALLFGSSNRYEANG
jgi:hypothetical protein